MNMDIWQKIFLYLGALIGAVMLMVALIVLSHSENGQLSLDGLASLSAPMASFYAFFRWFVYIWMLSALVIFVRFLRRTFFK